MNIVTREQADLASQRIARDPSARKIADALFSEAEPWLKRDDEAIRDLVPGASVLRTWTVNHITGCPTHGSGPEG